MLGVTSEPLPVLSGVPQGSILGPLLFLVYVNDLPKSTSNNTIVTMFADDTKCHRALQHPNDNKILQSDLDKITDWCHVWRMSLNQSKCGVLQFSRSQQPTTSEYILLGKPVKHTCSQKDLGIITISDLKWNKQIQEISSKANKMLGCVKRTALAIHEVRVRKVLYLTMVRSQLAYDCQVWAPQSVNNISIIERVQRRATKFILSLPYETDISYKERLVTIGIIPDIIGMNIWTWCIFSSASLPNRIATSLSRSMYEKHGHQRREYYWMYLSARQWPSKTATISEPPVSGTHFPSVLEIPTKLWPRLKLH